MAPLIETRGLTLHFGGLRAVDGVDFTLNPGEIHALIGPNGAGKTTFVSLLSGRRLPQSGTIRRGVLDVFVSHSAHVQEFGFHKQAILARLQELVPSAGITDIRCRLLADVDRTT